MGFVVGVGIVVVADDGVGTVVVVGNQTVGRWG